MNVPPQPRIRVDTAGPVATITLANPPLNLLSAAVLDALVDAAAAVGSSRARALVVRAEGDVFSAGVDVADFRADDEKSDADAVSRADTTFSRYLRGIVASLEALPMPTVAAVDGLCLTAGFELALACDLIVATDRAVFGLVEAALGLTPSMGGTQRLAARAGVSRAAELVLSGRTYDAQQMMAWGVVSRVLPADGFEGKVARQADRLASGPTLAHAATKRALAEYRRGGVPAADAALPGISAPLFATEDLKGGIQSFLADGPGKATFQGR